MKGKIINPYMSKTLQSDSKLIKGGSYLVASPYCRLALCSIGFSILNSTSRSQFMRKYGFKVLLGKLGEKQKNKKSHIRQ